MVCITECLYAPSTVLSVLRALTWKFPVTDSMVNSTFIHKTVLPFLWGTCSKIPYRCLKLWGVPNFIYVPNLYMIDVWYILHRHVIYVKILYVIDIYITCRHNFSYIYIPIMKFNFNIRYSKRLTTCHTSQQPQYMISFFPYLEFSPFQWKEALYSFSWQNWFASVLTLALWGISQ